MNYKITVPDGYVKPELPGGKAWVDALRSGAYKAGAFRLHDPQENTYCCLGVLCKVQQRLDKEDCESSLSATLYGSNPLFERLVGIGKFPEGVILFDEYDIRDTLIGINDSTYYSFNEIADIIEKIWDVK